VFLTFALIIYRWILCGWAYARLGELSIIAQWITLFAQKKIRIYLLLSCCRVRAPKLKIKKKEQKNPKNNYRVHIIIR